MSSDLPNLLQRLVRGGVDFVIVVGYAGVVHGCTLLTQDIDICCAFSGGNLLALREALTDLHPVHRMTPGRQVLELTAENAGQFRNRTSTRTSATSTASVRFRASAAMIRWRRRVRPSRSTAGRFTF